MNFKKYIVFLALIPAVIIIILYGIYTQYIVKITPELKVISLSFQDENLILSVATYIATDLSFESGSGSRSGESASVYYYSLIFDGQALLPQKTRHLSRKVAAGLVAYDIPEQYSKSIDRGLGLHELTGIESIGLQSWKPLSNVSHKTSLFAGSNWDDVRQLIQSQVQSQLFEQWAPDRLGRNIIAYGKDGEVLRIDLSEQKVREEPNMSRMYKQAMREVWFSDAWNYYFTDDRLALFVIPTIGSFNAPPVPIEVYGQAYPAKSVGILIRDGKKKFQVIPLVYNNMPLVEVIESKGSFQLLYTNIHTGTSQDIYYKSHLSGTNEIQIIVTDDAGNVLARTQLENQPVIPKGMPKDTHSSRLIFAGWDDKNKRIWWWRQNSGSISAPLTWNRRIPQELYLGAWDYQNDQVHNITIKLP